MTSLPKTLALFIPNPCLSPECDVRIPVMRTAKSAKRINWELSSTSRKRRQNLWVKPYINRNFLPIVNKLASVTFLQPVSHGPTAMRSAASRIQGVCSEPLPIFRHRPFELLL